MQTKKHLLLVCKIWRNLGMTILWEHIQISRYQTWKCLDDELATGSALGLQTKRLDVNFTSRPRTPVKQWTEVAVFERILPMFKKLEVVVVGITNHAPDASLLIPFQLSQLSPVSLRSLHWEVPSCSNLPILLNLPKFSHLEALELFIEGEEEIDGSTCPIGKILAVPTSACPNSTHYYF
jgi:hypothetical protein